MAGSNSPYSLSVNISSDEVRNVLGEVLQLGDRVCDLLPETSLIGNLPELDSMAIITVITALEEQFKIVFEDDDDISSAFETIASLVKYIESKI